MPPSNAVSPELLERIAGIRQRRAELRADSKAIADEESQLMCAQQEAEEKLQAEVAILIEQAEPAEGFEGAAHVD